MRAAAMAILVLAACGGGDEAGDTGGAPAITLRIDLPHDGAWYDEGEPVDFAVSAWRPDGSEAEVTAATWTLTDGARTEWSAEGVSFTATDLPPGDLEITCTAEAEGQDLEATVNIQVWATSG